MAQQRYREWNQGVLVVDEMRAAPDPVPVVFDRPGVLNYIVGLLGGGTTGRAALGAIIKACNDSAEGEDNFFAAYLNGAGPFTKTEFAAVLGDVSTSIVSAGQKAAVANNWPEA